MKKIIYLFVALSLLLSFALQPAYAIIAPKAVAPGIATPPDSGSVKTALAAFRSLSRKEKKERFKEIKKELKAYKAAKRKGDDTSTNTLLLVILSILLPPLAVYLHEGEINNRFWIDLILTLIFFLPGVIYALVVVLSDDNENR